MRFFTCSHCGTRVFFENTRCEHCGSRLGFVPTESNMVAFAPDGDWLRQDGSPVAQRPCSNYADLGVCNWMVAADDGTPLCLSCRTTSIIPALSKPENTTAWQQLEAAKRRLLYTLHQLGLSAPSRAEDPAQGIAFEFLEETPLTPKVLTGHDDGTITLNIAEADDARREQMRAAMNEPYRTLLGHFRHESGHYYWDRLIQNSPWLDEYRQLFGDERADYAEALNRHYAQPLADWPQQFISVYASSHPWEDWAECWAHYLHMVDGLETAASWGLRLDNTVPGAPPLVVQPLPLDTDSIDACVIEQWLPVSQLSNAMNRSLGNRDSYPFVLPTPVLGKLGFIHRVLRAARTATVAPELAPQTLPAATPEPEPAPVL